MPFSSGHETRLLDAEFDRNKIYFIISFLKWTKLLNRNIKLRNVSHKRSLSQSMSAVSCIPSIFMTVDMSSSSRIEKLPSRYSSESAEWKVLHEKKKQQQKKHMKTFIFFIWLISQSSVHSTFTTILFQVGKFAKIVLQVSVFLTTRNRSPFFPGFVSVIYLLWMFHDKKLTPFIIISLNHSTNAFENGVELK